DDELGSRFALLVRTREPEAAFAALQQPVWDALGAMRVALLPIGSRPLEVEGGSVVVETDTSFAHMLGEDRSRVILLRPDRYVAACFPIEFAESAAGAFEALLARSWGDASVLSQPETFAA